MKIFDIVPSWVYAIAVALLLVAVGAQQLRIGGYQVDVAQLEQDKAEVTAAYAQAVADDLTAKAALVAQHAQTQQQNEDRYVANLNALQTRNTSLAADNKRMSDKLSAYTSGGRQAGETDTAFCQRQSNRLQVIGGLFGEGLSLSAEGRTIIERRDAEVELLLGQIKADRLACSAE